MTEFEINKKVAEKLGVTDDYISFKPLDRYAFDPCNNVEQAWEIICKYKIDISFGDDVHPSLEGCAMAIKRNKSVTRDKPLVAAMLLFLEI